MKTLVIPSQNFNFSAPPSSNPNDCSCGMRSQLTRPNPDSSPCDAESQPFNPPNDPPGKFTRNLTGRLGDFARAAINQPKHGGDPYGGQENRPFGIMQPDQFVYGLHDNNQGKPAGNNLGTNTTRRRWDSWRQPAHQTTPVGQIRKPFTGGKPATPHQPVTHRRAESYNPCVGHTPATPISSNGAEVASAGSQSLLFLDLYSTGAHTPAQNYQYANNL